ncbi:MAG: hypothetical protein ACKOA9_13290 [Actinomycetota bacterium]
MTTRPPSGDSSEAGGTRPGDTRKSAAESTFDAAKDLLQSALEEVRAVPAEPAGPDPARAPGTRSSDTRRVPPPVEPTTDDESAEFWTKPVPEPRESARSGSKAAARRRRRPQTPAEPPTEAPVTSGADEFDDLAGTLYQSASAGRRRRRRPDIQDSPGANPAGDRAPAPTTAARRRKIAAARPVTLAAEAVATPTPDDIRTPEMAMTPDDASTTPSGGPRTGSGAAAPDRGTAPAPFTVSSMPPHSRRRAPGWIAAAIAAVLAIGVLAVVVTGGGGSDSTTDQAAVETNAKTRLTFPPVATAEGATVTRTWQLEGRKGDQFVGSLAITNPTAIPLVTTFTEVIPKAIASDVTQITFDPQPIVVKADPIVLYRLTVPPRGTVTVTYEVEVAPDGADRRRLKTWARELPTTSTTTTTAPPVTTVPTTPSTTPSKPPVTATPVTVAPTSPPGPPPTVPPATTGTISVVVVSRGQGGTFGFSTPLGPITLVTAGADVPASWSATVDPGTYTLAQSATPSFFYLYEVRCSNGLVTTASTVSIAVNAGESLSCTFDNRPR